MSDSISSAILGICTLFLVARLIQSRRSSGLYRTAMPDPARRAGVPISCRSPGSARKCSGPWRSAWRSATSAAMAGSFAVCKHGATPAPWGPAGEFGQTRLRPLEGVRTTREGPGPSGRRPLAWHVCPCPALDIRREPGPVDAGKPAPQAVESICWSSHIVPLNLAGQAVQPHATTPAYDGLTRHPLLNRGLLDAGKIVEHALPSARRWPVIVA